MEVKRLVFNYVQENTYVIWDETKECAVIDAGNSREQEDQYLFDFIEQQGLKPVVAINTHGHFDHTMGVESLRKEYNIPFAQSSGDQYLLDHFTEGDEIYGVKLGKMPKTIDIDLNTTPTLKVGNMILEVVKTPGHTPGHVSIYEPQSQTLFTGDTLFRESIGRTDLPGGDYAALMNSIVKQIIPMGDNVKIYPGHAEETTIGHETLYNPFIVEVINGEIKY